MFRGHLQEWGEAFYPADEDDIADLTRYDGTECGGEGAIVGEWR